MTRPRRSTTQRDYQLGIHIDLERDSRTSVPESTRVRPAPVIHDGEGVHGRIGALLAKVLDWIGDAHRLEIEVQARRTALELQIGRFRAHVARHGQMAASTRRLRLQLRLRAKELRNSAAAAREVASQIRGALDLICDYRTHLRGSHGSAPV